MATKKIPGVPPGTQTANLKALGIVDDRLVKLDALGRQVDQKMADPAFSTAGQQAALQKIKDDVGNATEVLEQERAVREQLEADLTPPADPDAAKDDLKQLNEHRKKTYPTYYKNGARVGADARVPCLTKQLAKVKPALLPTDSAKAADYITGIFEGGKPDYCAMADSPTDLGKLSYGKHQASETSGNLKAMLDRYSSSTEPTPDPTIKAQVDVQLGKFSANGMAYNGSAADRAAFKKTLKEACKDPAMQKTQDDFFKEQFWDPAVEKAGAYGVRSPLGQAIYYDMQIQGPGLVDGFSSKALKKWSDENDVNPPATACKPTDPNGPDEKEFLYLVNDQRRTKMQNSSNTDYQATTYRPDGLDRLLDADNTELSQDFVLRGQPVKGLP